MNQRQLSALSGNSRSETIPCAGYELVTTLTCTEPEFDRDECWQVTGTLTREGVPVETASVSDEERHGVWNALLAIVQGVGYETGIICTQGRWAWTILKEVRDEEAEQISLQHSTTTPVPS